MFKDAFEKLDPEQVREALPALNSRIEGAAFDAATTTIMAHDVDFYPGYRFLDLCAHDQNPARHRHCLEKDGEIVVLDWSNEPLYSLNRRAPLVLNESNVTAYVRFFMTYVKGSRGRFLIVESPDDIVWREEPQPAARKALTKMLEPLTLVEKRPGGIYSLTGCMIFEDALYKVRIEVGPEGIVTIGDEALLVEDMPVLDDALGQ